jgi:hypothetical protein
MKCSSRKFPPNRTRARICTRQLRPYQRQGAHWLWFMNRLGLGACLADDMGLGKTIQVISLLLVLKRRRGQTTPAADDGGPSLLIVPPRSSPIGKRKSRGLRLAFGLLRPSGGDAQRRSRRRANSPPKHWKAKTWSSPVTRWPCDWPGSRKSTGIWPSSTKRRRSRIRARARAAP